MDDRAAQLDQLEELIEAYAHADARRAPLLGDEIRDLAGELVMSGWSDRFDDPVVTALEVSSTPWRWSSGAERLPRTPFRVMTQLVLLAFVVGGIVVPIAWLTMSGLFGPLSLIMLMGLGLPMFFVCYMGLLMVFRTERRVRRHRRRLGQCAGCRYDLTGVPGEIEAGELGGFVLGPRVCPECGRRWPLLG